MADPGKRILLLRKYFMECTDEEHGVTMQELIAYLHAAGVDADRRTVYGDMRRLAESGLSLEKARRDTFRYFLSHRTFELAELKLLVDAVQSCRFLTVKKSNELIGKLEGLASRYQAAQLSRQVYVQNRLKTDNERIYYNVDSIHTAIQSARKIRFQYCQYTLQKQLEPRRNGAAYVVSPYLLTWAEDNYYLIADHPQHEGLAHFRVDKMQEVTVLEEKRDSLSPLFDPARYARSMFSMYAGDSEWVEMEFGKELIGVVIDRFGTDAAILEKGEDTFTVRAAVSVSSAFFGWIFQFGDRARILAPEDARQRMTAYLMLACRNYSSALFPDRQKQ